MNLARISSLAAVALALTVSGPAAAQLRFAQPSVDLGTVRGGPILAHRFACVNDGNTPLEIVEIRRGCGCLTPTVERLTLAPGEHAALTFQVRTLGQQAGPRPWRADVRWRQDGTEHETALTIAATLVHEVTVEPAVLALYVGTALRQEVRVTDTRKLGLTVSAATVSVPGVGVAVRKGDGGITTVVLDVAGAAVPPTPTSATLDLTTDDPAYRHLQIPLTLMRASALQVNAAPTTARLHLARARPVAVALVRLRPSDAGKVVVEKATSDEAGLSATWAAGPGAAATLRIRADLRRLTDRVGPHALRVRLSEPAGAEVVVPVAIAIDD